MRDLDQASGVDWGGISVEKAYKSVLAEIVTEEVLENYQKKYPSDYLDLFQDLERNKHRCQSLKNLPSCITFHIPNSFSEECLLTLGKDLTTLINNSKFKDQITLRFDKIRMKLKLFETFYHPACNGIVKHLKELFQSPKVKDVNKILMIGGLSESYILQDAIQTAFPYCQVFVPKEASLAVLRGAVVFSAYYPRFTFTRHAKYTYGVEKITRFDPVIHKDSKKRVIEGVEYCTGLFEKLVEKGEQLFFDKANHIKHFIPLAPDQTSVSFRLYESVERNPFYIDQCTCVGTVEVNVPVGLKERLLELSFNFYDPEFKVMVSVSDSELIFTALFNELEC